MPREQLSREEALAGAKFELEQRLDVHLSSEQEAQLDELEVDGRMTVELPGGHFAIIERDAMGYRTTTGEEGEERVAENPDEK